MMDALPLISIIVPVYKVEPYLRKCVDSILAQTYTNIEVILVDDGSPDGCPAICDEYRKQDERVVVIHQENGGLSAARNAGLNVARGEYIGFVDSDDWIEPDMYEVLFQLISATESDVSIVDVCSDTENSVEPPSKNDEIYVFNSDETMKELLLNQKFKSYMWVKLYKASLFNNIRFPQERILFEDMVVSSELFGYVNKAVYQEYHCYHYLLRQDSLSHKFNDRYWTIQTACDMLCKNVNKLMPQMKVYADSVVIKNIIPLANVAADNNELSKENYRKIELQLKSHVSRKSLRLVPHNYRLWYYLFISGRTSFVFLRKFLTLFNIVGKSK